MTALWMGYAVLVTLALGGAAHAAEKALRSTGAPGRWPWLAAMAGSWALALLALLRPGTPPSRAPSVVGMTEGGPVVPIGHDGAVTGWFESLFGWPGSWPGSWPASGPGSGFLAAADGWVGPLWAASATVAGLVLVAAVVSLVRRSRRWPEARVLDEPVRVSPSFGPAVVGVLAPRIVLPRWALRLDPRALRLVLLHEGEHRGARDTLVLALGAVAAVAAPWNLPLWWQLRRLRLAVELDCDGRVMRRGATPREYGALLVEIGERLGPVGFPAAALAEGTSFLERRLRMITETGTGRSGWRAAGAAVLATGMVALACETPAPTEVSPTGTADAVSTLVERPDVSAGTVEPADRPEPAGTFGFDAVRIPSDPLIVVDGVVAGDMGVADIQALDVARIEVVKGAAAEALFGSRAKNGLVRVTTREAAGLETGEAVYTIREEAKEPGAAGTVRLRAPEAPLFVVDGVIDRGMTMEDVRALDPERIESIEVVKGGAARAIYGSRAAAGVVIVRTKGSGG